MRPIFILWARSFWGAVVTAVLVLSEADDATARSLGSFIAAFVGGDMEAWGEVFSHLPPVLTLAFTLQQRSGAARPYTINPNAKGALS